MERECIGFQQAFGAIGCAFGPRTTVPVGVTTSVKIPAGVWLIETDAHELVRDTYDAGTSWITVLGASGVGMVFSDGFNTEFRGDGTGGTAHRSQVLPLA